MENKNEALPITEFEMMYEIMNALEAHAWFKREGWSYEKMSKTPMGKGARFILKVPNGKEFSVDVTAHNFDPEDS